MHKTLARTQCTGPAIPLVAVPLNASAIGQLLIKHSPENIHGEFDPGSGRTLAACLTHASRTVKPFGVDQWRTGE
jgi:hypothetical protein